MSIIIARDLTKSYQNGTTRKVVLKHIDLEIKSGSFTAIIGPSGSGKTTLLYAISGLDTPDEGTVLLSGYDLTNNNEKIINEIRRDKIGFVFQFYHLIPSLTVYENLILRQVISSKKGFEIDEVLNAVGLISEKHKYPHMLSGGQQQRVAIARAILNKPDVLFADEPTGNLDYQASLEIMQLLKDLNERFKITIIMVTHNDQLLSYANRIITLLDGRVINDVEK